MRKKNHLQPRAARQGRKFSWSRSVEEGVEEAQVIEWRLDWEINGLRFGAALSISDLAGRPYMARALVRLRQEARAHWAADALRRDEPRDMEPLVDQWCKQIRASLRI